MRVTEPGIYWYLSIVDLWSILVVSRLEDGRLLYDITVIEVEDGKFSVGGSWIK